MTRRHGGSSVAEKYVPYQFIKPIGIPSFASFICITKLSFRYFYLTKIIFYYVRKYFVSSLIGISKHQSAFSRNSSLTVALYAN